MSRLIYEIWQVWSAELYSPPCTCTLCPLALHKRIIHHLNVSRNLRRDLLVVPSIHSTNTGCNNKCLNVTALVWECRNSRSSRNACVWWKDKWVQMMQCVKFFLSLIPCAWLFFLSLWFFFWTRKLSHWRFPLLYNLHQFLEAFSELLCMNNPGQITKSASKQCARLRRMKNNRINLQGSVKLQIRQKKMECNMSVAELKPNGTK